MVNVWQPLSLFLCTSTNVAVDVLSLKLYREEKVPLIAAHSVLAAEKESDSYGC